MTSLVIGPVLVSSIFSGCPIVLALCQVSLLGELRWTWEMESWYEFESWTRMFSLDLVLMLFGKAWILLSLPHAWINRIEVWVFLTLVKQPIIERFFWKLLYWKTQKLLDILRSYGKKSIEDSIFSLLILNILAFTHEWKAFGKVVSCIWL